MLLGHQKAVHVSAVMSRLVRGLYPQRRTRRPLLGPPGGASQPVLSVMSRDRQYCAEHLWNVRLAPTVKRVSREELFGDPRSSRFDCVSGELKSNELLLYQHPGLFAFTSEHRTQASSPESIFLTVDFIVSGTKCVCFVLFFFPSTCYPFMQPVALVPGYSLSLMPWLKGKVKRVNALEWSLQ